MRFLIISHALHKTKNNQLFSYGPYVREMNLWLKYVDNVEIIAPITDAEINKIDLEYRHKDIIFNKVSAIQFTTLKNAIVSFLKLPIIFFVLFKACFNADHIHLRCPGNMGLLGCFVQVFFPKKNKTAKYAGNWDPNAKQPLSYRFQKWILSNTFLTKNITVLVYGTWEKQTKNIKPFFTATYSKDDVKHAITSIRFPLNYKKDNQVSIKFIFVGALTPGKRPLLAVKVIKHLVERGYNVTLDLFGDGPEYNKILDYINDNELQKIVKLHGNVSKDFITEQYKISHFLLFISKSEGWPKVVAEAMFWGCLPISSSVSCVPYMLDNGNRGALVDENIEIIGKVILDYLSNLERYNEQVEKAIQWSRQYTMDKFDKEIRKLVTAKNN